ncbi:hypothetical protein BDZ89DRAFT_1042820 [Hymenopellis radicata]|nr:hypothetical protein BDZ89DRAFT_1042820 [Hymenopellis radicata]
MARIRTAISLLACARLGAPAQRRPEGQKRRCSQRGRDAHARRRRDHRMLGTINAFLCGIGGGGWFGRRENIVSALWTMITMPALGNETMYSNNTATTVGGLSVGVPGELCGRQTLHARHESSWADLLQPAIRLARYGFTVTQDLWPRATLSSPTDVANYTAILIQATKFAYGQRTTVGDPAFTKKMTRLEKRYLTDEVVQKVREMLPHNETYEAKYYDPASYQVLSDNGTSHMAAVDKDGNAVSLTTTVNLGWGSRF